MASPEGVEAAGAGARDGRARRARAVERLRRGGAAAGERGLAGARVRGAARARERSARGGRARSAEPQKGARVTAGPGRHGGALERRVVAAGPQRRAAADVARAVRACALPVAADAIAGRECSERAVRAVAAGAHLSERGRSEHNDDQGGRHPGGAANRPHGADDRHGHPANHADHRRLLLARARVRGALRL